MRINMSRWLTSVSILSLVGCNSATDYSREFVSGNVVVHEVFWAKDHDRPYPFTTSGEISCVYYPTFGTEVYFEPAGFTDESSIGTPLNKAATKSLKHNAMEPNVPYSIKDGADLKEAVEVGLSLCGEQQSLIDKI